MDLARSDVDTLAQLFDQDVAEAKTADGAKEGPARANDSAASGKEPAS